jgi:hypothetical protein
VGELPPKSQNLKYPCYYYDVNTVLRLLLVSGMNLWLQTWWSVSEWGKAEQAIHSKDYLAHSQCWGTNREMICCYFIKQCKLYTVIYIQLMTVNRINTWQFSIPFKITILTVKSGVPLRATLQYCHAILQYWSADCSCKLQPTRTNCNFYIH